MRVKAAANIDDRLTGVLPDTLILDSDVDGARERSSRFMICVTRGMLPSSRGSGASPYFITFRVPRPCLKCTRVVVVWALKLDPKTVKMLMEKP